MTDTTAEIIWVSGPVMRSSGGQFLSMYEMVEVGAARLIGEVIAFDMPRKAAPLLFVRGGYGKAG